MYQLKKALIGILLLCMMLSLAACMNKTCHYCGNKIQGSPVEAGGRIYCSYDHYMQELFSGK